MKKSRLTVGYRARILTLKEKPRNKKHLGYEGHSWRRDYGGREVLLSERDANCGFSVMLLDRGVTKLIKDKNIISNEMAWVPESDMAIVDDDLGTNLDFMDWYKDNEENY